MSDLKDRMKALEAEMADLRIQMWAQEADCQHPQHSLPENKHSNPDSLISFTIAGTPMLTRRNSVSTQTLLESQDAGDQLGPASMPDSINTLDRTAQPINDVNILSGGESPNNNTCNNVLADSEQHQVVNPGVSLASDNFDSPPNASNPHPKLSISIAFLHKAIVDCRKPGSKFVRSVLHREPLNAQASEWPGGRFAEQYTEWRWIPFLVSGDAAELVSTNISQGDIELICMKDKAFTEMINDKTSMFEEPSRLLDVSVLLEELQPDFSPAEAWGYRVLAWKIHGIEDAFYMDRQGHPIPGPLCLLPWQMTPCED
ncbi:hypothetical protein FSARC_10365 [Fusarium sarcochroum]|uniref:Uncharacterized protein n=1 Tax=Fusarium sarcochroum TaxID=1208366 RepID=A0A8H4X3R7_9HYPO|nr:hypothetical protein FSARC_10365 [Fusarium sarcochroum]